MLEFFWIAFIMVLSMVFGGIVGYATFSWRKLTDENRQLKDDLEAYRRQYGEPISRVLSRSSDID